MPALHALGDGFLILALQQRNRAHLPLIEPNRVVVLVEHPGSKVQFALVSSRGFVVPFSYRGLRDDGVRRGASSLRGCKVLVQDDPDTLEGREQIVNLLRRVQLGGQDLLYFFREQVSPLFSYSYKIAHLFVHFFSC